MFSFRRLANYINLEHLFQSFYCCQQCSLTGHRNKLYFDLACPILISLSRSLSRNCGLSLGLILLDLSHPTLFICKYKMFSSIIFLRCKSFTSTPGNLCDCTVHDDMVFIMYYIWNFRHKGTNKHYNKKKLMYCL